MGRLWFMFGACLCLCQGLTALDISLRPAATVSSSAVTLGMIADLAPADAALAQVVILQAPSVGRWTLSAAHIRSADPRLAAQSITGSCTVVRPGHDIPAADLLAAVETHIRADPNPDRVALQFVGQPAGAVAALGATISWVAEPLGEAYVGRCAFRVRVLADGVECARRLITVEVQRWAMVAVAAGPLRRNQVIGAGDWLIEERRMDPNNRDALRSATAAFGQTLNLDVADRSPLQRRWLRPTAVVRAGETVRATIRIGNAEAETTVVALGDGGDGAAVQVRRLGDPRSWPAFVVGPGVVRISGR